MLPVSAVIDFTRARHAAFDSRHSPHESEETTIVTVKTTKTIITVETVKSIIAVETVKMIVAEPVCAVDAPIR